MNELKRVKNLTIDDKLLYYKWLLDHIAEAEENAPWMNGEKIYKCTLKLTT